MKIFTVTGLSLFVSLSAYAEQWRMATPNELHPQCFELEEVDCADLSQDGCLEGKTVVYKDRGETCEQIRGEGRQQAFHRILEETARRLDIKRILNLEGMVADPNEIRSLEPNRIQRTPLEPGAFDRLIREMLNHELGR